MNDLKDQLEQQIQDIQEETVEEIIPKSTDDLIKEILDTELNFLLSKAQTNTLSLDDARKLETLVKVVTTIDIKPITSNTGTISNEDLIKFLTNT